MICRNCKKECILIHSVQRSMLPEHVQKDIKEPYLYYCSAECKDTHLQEHYLREEVRDITA